MCTYLNYTVWYVLIYVYACETVTAVTIMNKLIILEFLCAPGNLPLMSLP